MDLRQYRSLDCQLFLGGENLCGAFGDGFSILIDRHTLNGDELFVIPLFGDRQCDSHGIADLDRVAEGQRLAEINGAGAGQYQSERCGNHRASPGAVGDTLAEHGFGGEFRIDMDRIHIAGNFGKKDDVALGERLAVGGSLTNGDLFVSEIIQRCHQDHSSKIRQHES